MSKDILLYESGNGGELLIINNDLALSETLFQQVYICLFGGNVEAVTKGNELETEVRKDWWGNFLNQERTEKQFNSLTEKALINNPLTSSGRIKIQNAVEQDLADFKKVCDINVVISINTNKTTIAISLKKPQNQEDKILQIIWDNAKNEIINTIII